MKAKTTLFPFVGAIASMSMMALIATGCQKTVPGDELIAFRMLDKDATKTTAVTSLDASGFRVSAVTGTPGSELEAWTDIPFSKSGDYFVGGKFWPNDEDPGYVFYAANVPLSYSAAGATITASNSTDIVCAYKTSNAWKSRPTLYFKHIFARVSTVTVAPMDGYDISDITIWLVNAKTGGTYNLRTGNGQTDGTGWSSLTPAGAADTQLFRYAGEITDGNSQTGSDNDLYVVPGEYYLKGSWVSGGNTYSGVLSNSTLSIVGGKVNTLACVMEGSAGIILSTLDGITWSYSTTFGVGMDTDPLAWPSPTDFSVSSSDNITWGEGLDLSLVNPLTGESMSRETANCYIVTEPGVYCVPLFYGNAVVNGSDNLYTAAPAKVNANDGVFVNAYDVAISSGNIKTDIENAGKVLNTSGGKLIWSTASATAKALIIVDPIIDVKNGIGYLSFTVPSSGFREGSALIGVLKDGSTDEYVWAWHIWITNGSVLATDEYTNYQSQTIDMLNRALGGWGVSYLINVYYQYGMPFPLPPSNGSGNPTITLYDENGTYTFNYDSDNTITTLGKALSKPYLPRWNNGFFNNASGTAQNFYNMWDATQTSTATDKTVVKTIYDPSPAGMTVPRLNAFTGFTKTGKDASGESNFMIVYSYYDQGLKFKRNSSDETGVKWGNSGYRYSTNIVMNVNRTGSYWSACPRRHLNIYYWGSYSSSNKCEPKDSDERYYAYSIRPALSEL